MPRKRESSNSSSSSPEKKIVSNQIIEGRRSLRSRNIEMYPSLPVDAVFGQHESSRSPVRYFPESKTYNEEEIEGMTFRPRAGSYDMDMHQRLKQNVRTSPSPSPVPETPKQRHKTPAPKIKPTETTNSTTIVIFVILLTVVVVGGLIFKTSNVTNEKSTTECSILADLKEKFPGQDQKLFKSLKIGVEGAMNGTPMVFSLFSTDMHIIDSVMEQVLKATQKCINQSQDPINLNSGQLNTKLVEDYRDALTSRTIMVINNLEKAQATNVPSLHSFCDTFNPLVAKSIIFITFQVPESPPGKPIEYITEFLNRQWKTLPDNIRSPLITRILDQTFFLKP